MWKKRKTYKKKEELKVGAKTKERKHIKSTVNSEQKQRILQL